MRRVVRIYGSFKSKERVIVIHLHFVHDHCKYVEHCLVVLLVIRWLAASVASWDGREKIADDFLEGGQGVHSLTEDDRELDRDEEADGGEVDDVAGGGVGNSVEADSQQKAQFRCNRWLQQLVACKCSEGDTFCSSKWQIQFSRLSTIQTW